MIHIHNIHFRWNHFLRSFLVCRYIGLNFLWEMDGQGRCDSWILLRHREKTAAGCSWKRSTTWVNINIACVDELYTIYSMLHMFSSEETCSPPWAHYLAGAWYWQRWIHLVDNDFKQSSELIWSLGSRTGNMTQPFSLVKHLINFEAPMCWCCWSSSICRGDIISMTDMCVCPSWHWIFFSGKKSEDPELVGSMHSMFTKHGGFLVPHCDRRTWTAPSHDGTKAVNGCPRCWTARRVGGNWGWCHEKKSTRTSQNSYFIESLV